MATSRLKIDLTGRRFDYLLVIERAPNLPESSSVRWLCRCDCGDEKVIRGSDLKSGETKSCGCKRREVVHGLTGSPEYRSWAAAIQRCTNPKNPHFTHYGGRGIDVCPQWKESFEVFYSDMGERPEGTSLDRIDPNGNYCKDNCRWADQRMQCYNRRKSTKNKSGRTGVSWNERDQVWVASWKEGGKKVSRYFKTLEEAVHCREEAELRLYGELKEVWMRI